ncbi:rhodanese-related sulfurtransferase [Bartonella schoenbuchensis]|uniref:tRNA uridine(34) hydroxylase n=1 Tax=Bartonella schoenbuchensis m07a TaxID=1094496 RepID=N6VB33_9HYPH|nr:rhodanese-related sulfurtransferase [Bartonella schoenbuchensis]ENN91005.1 putative rhodanese-related sulfurtransferase protein [Bartonella schoenbuchensis m07a]
MEKNFKVAALYCFADLEHYHQLQKPLRDLCQANGIKGTLLLAKEGINGTVAGSCAAIEALVHFITAQPALQKPELKYSWASKMPFHRMKVRLKKEIVTMGVEGVNPLEIVGTYVEPEDWNALIQDEETILIDTRNDYEYALGSFQGAIDPRIKTFREFPEWVAKHEGDLKKKKKIAMFCTGGIRCEKSTAYVRGLGYDQVYHLKGGILRYLETMPKEKSLWWGECFVFDERVSVSHGLEECGRELCRACRYPLNAEGKLSPHYEEGVSCDACYNTRSDADRQRFRERHKQFQLLKSRAMHSYQER